MKDSGEYFNNSNPCILGNDKLRKPQQSAYSKVLEHFIMKNKKTHAIIVLPTGVGKTGLMGLLPYHICKGKVLIITPQLTIKDTIVDSLNPDNPSNFWLKRSVFKSLEELPSLAEFDSTVNSVIEKKILDDADIVILNIQKLQSRLQSSPLKFLPSDFFDMIIIDEAHHSTANTWVETTEYFRDAKVIKLTGTPIRTDGVDLVGELVYKYKLSQAMSNGYVKSLKNLEYIPDKLYLTIDNKPEKYSVEEILEQGIRDEDWIKRSVAFSPECSMHVVEKSIELLNNKRQGTTVPHKIIAVACSISHAEQIKQMYIDKGFKAEVIHSKQSLAKREEVKKNIENHRLDVIINVAMLGEGYDHPYLSVAAIFRPFRSELPYEQFIGRVLRVIPKDEVGKTDDNIAEIVSHKNLKLTELWQKYKNEIQESEVIKHLQNEPEFDISEATSSGENGSRIIDIGNATESKHGTVSEDIYLTTELIRKQKEESEKAEIEIRKLQQLLHIEYDQAFSIYNSTKNQDTAAIKRPDLYFRSKKKDIDTEIREIIIPELMTKYSIDIHSDSLINCRLFKSTTYSWIINRPRNNGAMLGLYFNTYLKNTIGKKRELWSNDDYDLAVERLEIVKEYVEKVIFEYSQK